MKKHILALTLALAMTATLAGCGGNGSDNSSTGTSTDGTTAGGTTAATTAAATTAGGTDFGLADLVGKELPNVEDPAELGDRVKSEDGKWVIDNNCTVEGTDKALVASTGEAVAFFAGQSLGTAWKAQANFVPIECFTVDQPVCCRLFIHNEDQTHVLLLSVNFIDKSAENLPNNVELDLQVYNGKRWKSLYNSNGWIETESTVFHFELSRAEGSKKIQLNVTGDKGELVNRETIAEIADDLVDTPVLAGFGVSNSAVQYSSIKVEGNGPTTGFKFGELEF